VIDVLHPLRDGGICTWLLISTIGVQPMEVKVNFRSVMPLDVLGDTRVTILQTEGILEISFWEGGNPFPGRVPQCLPEMVG
jgi:hypothetical protein